MAQPTLASASAILSALRARGLRRDEVLREARDTYGFSDETLREAL